MLRDERFRVLSLDGGGARGVLSLGALQGVEQDAGAPLCEVFELIYGTSTGGIIAALLALGWTVEDIKRAYRELVPDVMSRRSASGRSARLEVHARALLAGKDWSSVSTRLGIVAAAPSDGRPMVFKSHADMAYGSAGFVPGFGASLADALLASSAAEPFFRRRTVVTGNGRREAIDGGFVANNPLLFALVDAVKALGNSEENVDALSIGTGAFPAVRRSLGRVALDLTGLPRLMEETLTCSSGSMGELAKIMFPGVRSVRINHVEPPEGLRTDLLERRSIVLSRLEAFGAAAYVRQRAEVLPMLGVRGRC